MTDAEYKPIAEKIMLLEKMIKDGGAQGVYAQEEIVATMTRLSIDEQIGLDNYISKHYGAPSWKFWKILV